MDQQHAMAFTPLIFLGLFGTYLVIFIKGYFRKGYMRTLIYNVRESMKQDFQRSRDDPFHRRRDRLRSTKQHYRYQAQFWVAEGIFAWFPVHLAAAAIILVIAVSIPGAAMTVAGNHG